MPLHDYKCGECGHQFEKLVGVQHGVKEPRKCPECGKLRLKRLLFTRPPVAHMRYSPMHPRQGRGMSRR
jgi:putative FmdB family regulatory protein